MDRNQISVKDFKKHPTNSNWTMPKTWGVWEVPLNSTGNRYRYGNYPVRGVELAAKFGSAVRLALYCSRQVAKDHADELNA